MGVPIWQSLLVMMKTGRVIANSGALWRLIRLRRPPNIAGLFPFMAIPIVALLGYLLGAFIGGFLGGGIVSIVLGIVGLVGASLWFRRIDNVHLAYYMLHDLGLIT